MSGDATPATDRSAGAVPVLLAAAAGIHFAVGPAHLGESLSHGGFMFATGATQLALAALIARRPSRRALELAAWVSGGIVAIWLASRISGSEPVGAVDLVATVLEAVTAALALAVLRPPVRARRLLQPVALVLAVVVGVAVAASSPEHDHEHDHGSAAVAAGVAGHEHGSAAVTGAPASLASLHGGHGAPEVADRGPDPDRAPNAPLDGRQVRVGGQPEAVLLAAGSVWVADRAGGTVSRFDPVTLAPIGGAVDVGRSPAGLAFAAGRVWVTSWDDDVVRPIDAATGEPAGPPIPVGAQPIGITAAGDTVWVANSSDGTVTRIDARRGTVIDTSARLGYGVLDVVSAFGSVWAVASLDHTVVRIDPATNTASAPPIEVPQGAVSLAAGDGYLWVPSTTAGTLTRIDPRTSEVSGLPVTIDATTTPGQGPGSVAVAAGRAWVANTHDKTVVAVDTATRAPVGVTRWFANELAPYRGVTHIVTDGRALFVTNYDAGTLTRIAIA